VLEVGRREFEVGESGSRGSTGPTNLKSYISIWIWFEECAINRSMPPDYRPISSFYFCLPYHHILSLLITPRSFSSLRNIPSVTKMKFLTCLLFVVITNAVPQGKSTTYSLGKSCADNVLIIARGSTEPGNVVSIINMFLPG
jgi:hypothetical protein